MRRIGERKSLIPRALKLRIPQARINKLYDELQHLDIQRFTNNAAASLRVFLELSIDHYAEEKKLKLKRKPTKQLTAMVAKGKVAIATLESNNCLDESSLSAVKYAYSRLEKAEQDSDMSLREKLQAVLEHIGANGNVAESKLLGARALAGGQDQILSIDSLNGYLHNKDYYPDPVSLKALWDNIQPFVEELWNG